MSNQRTQLLSPVALTDGQSNDQLLYFTSNSMTDDGGTVVVISDRDGQVNLHAIDVATGNRRVLTNNHSGYLRSYVYFDGQDRKGVGKASVSLDTARGLVYYIQDDAIRVCSLDGTCRKLATVPENEITAFTHVSQDGRLLCVPTTQARALDGPLGPHGRPAHDIDQRVQDENLCSWLNVYDTTTGEQVLRKRVDRGWVTHVQFSPVNSQHILYNHEWSADRGLRRIWLFDGDSHRPLRPLTDGRSKDDWACHEVWSADGRAVIYHGGFANQGLNYVGKLTLDGKCDEIAFPETFRGYGHFTTHADGRLVTDGYFHGENDPPRTSRYITIVHPDWQNHTLRWQALCEHGSSWTSQDAHPHPVFTPDGKWVLFTSDQSGKRVVYKVPAT